MIGFLPPPEISSATANLIRLDATEAYFVRVLSLRSADSHQAAVSFGRSVLSVGEHEQRRRR